MKLLVLDGNSILNRAFYGIKLLTTKDGLFTNGIYGFYNILNKLMEDVKPDAVAVAFDLKAPTFRHLQFDGYKAKRKGMPEELAAQMPLLKEMLDKMGITRLETEGFEADDILGTEARAARERGDECVIATGDRDSLQLICESVVVSLAATKAGRPETTVYDEARFFEEYGVKPRQLIELKALMGDTSDNIPGVPGVGQKTASDLIKKYSSVQNIYDNIDTLDIKDSVKNKLIAGKESAFMSRELAEIRTDAPVETAICALKDAKPDRAGLYSLFIRLEFYKAIEKMGLKPQEDSGADAQTPQAVTVTELKDGEALLSKIRKAGAVDFFAEITADGFKSVCFAFDGEAFYTDGQENDLNSLLRSVFEDEHIIKRTHDIKGIYAACVKAGFQFKGGCFDTMLAGYLLNPSSSSYEPERLCGELHIVPPCVEGENAIVSNAVMIHALFPVLSEKIKENGQENLYYNIELPLSKVLCDMESLGFRVDAKGIESFGEALNTRILEMQSEIYGYVGYDFNINSTKQLGEALFVKLGLPAKKKTKTGFSTNAEVLESLRGHHPIIELLLEFRQLTKLKSTYVDGLLKVIGGDGRIHSSFNQVETRTGRISSTEPNLQNIPVRSELGREMRKFFIPAEGCVLIDADYSQIELRILAHIADDSAMQEAFNNHVDIHALTASQVFKMPIDMVTPLMRSRAKAVNFGIVYGISAFSLSQDIGVSVKEADSYIKGYLDTFSGVRKYMEYIISDAKQKGYVETLLGRRRLLPELAASNANIRGFGERVARNTPIQGTAADIIKIAMVKVHERLLKEGLRSKLILQVHDELIVEAPAEEAEAAAKVVHEEMENAMAMKVKLEADVHMGDSWFTAKG